MGKQSVSAQPAEAIRLHDGNTRQLGIEGEFTKAPQSAGGLQSDLQAPYRTTHHRAKDQCRGDPANGGASAGRDQCKQQRQDKGNTGCQRCTGAIDCR